MTDFASGGHEPTDRRPPLVDAQRRVKRGRILILVLVTTGIVALGLVLGFHSPARLVESPDPAPALQVPGMVLVVAGLVTCLAGGIRARRAGALRFVWNSPTATLDRPDRRRLLDRIRADDDVPQVDQEVAVALANQLARQQAVVPSYVGLMVYFIGQSLVTSSPLERWPAVVAFVLFAVGIPFLVRDARRARMWLDHRGSSTR